MKIEVLSNITDDNERAFYGCSYCDFDNINISGPLDGESAFKECDHIRISESNFDLRYPFWHNDYLEIKSCYFSDKARAPLWYCDNVRIIDVEAYCVKPLRECSNVGITSSKFECEEFAWKVKNIILNNAKVKGFYSFFECSDIQASNLTFEGKYSFQYCKNVQIVNSELNTKDAFWHSKDVIVENSIVKGEYLGWYSENLTLINCKIIGTQPLCYCKNLTLIDCTFEGADFAFEYSEVSGNIVGTLVSIKNPLSGLLRIDEYPEIIIDAYDQSNGDFSIILNEDN